MRMTKSLITLGTLILLAVTFGCGGGGGGSSSGSSTGTVSMSITDAKPVLPANVTNCFVTIDKVFVHKSGGEWVELEMVETPYIIDLLQFVDMNKTEFVPPAPLPTGIGKYTQVRLEVSSALLVANGKSYSMTIPSENLKTDKNFDFTVDEGENASVDITIDFDLSQSIVVEGPADDPSYKLKPVLHIVETEKAATIEGTIAYGNFLDPVVPGNPPIPPYVVITVFDSTGQEYTKVQVDRKGSDTNKILTDYSIYWLVPDQDYTVKIDYNPVTGGVPPQPEDTKTVLATDFDLNGTATVDFL